MSSAKCVRNTLTESPRIPGEGLSAQGKAGPKARPKGVADGQQVEIPAPRSDRLTEGVTQEARRIRVMEVPDQGSRHAAQANPRG